MPRKKLDPAGSPVTVAEKTAEIAAKLEAEVAHICGRCWPDGWSHLAVTAGCEHGQFERANPADPDAPPAQVPVVPALSDPAPAAVEDEQPPSEG